MDLLFKSDKSDWLKTTERVLCACCEKLLWACWDLLLLKMLFIISYCCNRWVANKKKIECSKIGRGQRSRFLLLTERIVASGEENGANYITAAVHVFICNINVDIRIAGSSGHLLLLSPSEVFLGINKTNTVSCRKNYGLYRPCTTTVRWQNSRGLQWPAPSAGLLGQNLLTSIHFRIEFHARFRTAVNLNTSYLLKNWSVLRHQWTSEQVRNLREIQHIFSNCNTYAMSWLWMITDEFFLTAANQNVWKIVWCTHIIRRGKYSIGKIFYRKVVLWRDLNEGHFNATISLSPRCTR